MVSIKNFEGSYSISETGEVFSHEKSHRSGFKGRGVTIRKERTLTPQIDKDGYLVIILYQNSKPHSRKIHRLVAEAYIPNPENKRYVNHIDGNKKNNTIQNLEWCTQSENAQHAYRTGLKTSTIRKYASLGGAHFAKPISAFCKKTNALLWTEESIKSACRKHNLDQRTVQRVIANKPNFNSHKGMYFKVS